MVEDVDLEGTFIVKDDDLPAAHAIVIDKDVYAYLERKGTGNSKSPGQCFGRTQNPKGK